MSISDSSPRRRRSYRAIAAAALVAAAAVGLGRAAEPEPRVLRSDRLNGTYRDMVADIEPVSWGLFTVDLSSPTHTLEVHDHALSLGPAVGAGHAGRLTVALEGEAHLIAKLDLAGMPGGRLEDQITLPAQELELGGVVEIEAVPEGYRVTTVELPQFVELAIESRLGGKLVSLCEGLSFLGGGCDGLERAFSTVRLPLPEPGEVHLLEAADLTAKERRQIDDYLAGR